MTAKKTAIELLEKVRAIFNAPVIEVAAADPMMPPAPIATPYKLQDGSDIIINQSGEEVQPGDSVVIAGAPAPEGPHTLEDGTVITVDAAGIIVSIDEPVETAPEPITNSVQPVIAPVLAAAQTPETLNTLIAAFATGTPEERIANLEIVAKALMDNCMGYELREAQAKAGRDAAIAIYNQGLTTANAQMAKQDEVIKQMFDLCEVLTKEPSAEPITVPEGRKGKFSRSKDREDRFENIAKAVTELKNKK